ncbi:MAG: methyltransferase domain-containing protein [Acidobacteria bacterium]|nr:methyltransferase domain-containing protein [Acidobacteriota bacterium]
MTDRILNSFQLNLFRQILSTEGLAIPETAEEVFELQLHHFATKRRIPLEQLPFRLKEEAALRRALTEKLIVHESYFYREPHHFFALTRSVLPELAKCKSRPITILSAGCAAGEEVYSIRISLLEELPALSGEIRITGMDRSKKIIEAAEKACYSNHALRELPAELKQKYLKPLKNGFFSPVEAVRENVDFVQADLLKETPVKDSYDIIFCRNVMMYLTNEARERLKLNFEAALKAGGAFFFGTTEAFFNPPPTFRKLHFGNAFFYRKTGKCQ